MSAAGTSGPRPSTTRRWIDSREPPVPAAFRPHLEAGGALDGARELSVAGLLRAAETAMRSCAQQDPGERAAAFSLLAADAHVTFACLLVLAEGGGSEELRRVARQVGKMDVERRQ